MIARLAHLLGFREPDPQTRPEGHLFAHGDTVPADGTSGFATGCLFQHTDGGVGTSLYVNEGTFASCDFNAK